MTFELSMLLDYRTLKTRFEFEPEPYCTFAALHCEPNIQKWALTPSANLAVSIALKINSNKLLKIGNLNCFLGRFFPTHESWLPEYANV